MTQIKSNFWLSLRYFIGFSVIAALIFHVESQEDIIPVLSNFNISILLPVFMLILVHLLCLFTLWKNIILRVGQLNPGYNTLIHSFLGGRTLGFITPGNMGELLKGLFFASGVRLKGTSLSMIYAGYGMFIRTLLGSIAVIYFIFKIPESLEINLTVSAGLFILIILSTIIFLLFHQNTIRSYFIHYLPQQGVELLRLFKFQLGSKSIKQFISLLSISLAANLLAALAFILVLTGFNINVLNIHGLMAFEAAYFAMSLLPITPSGIGIREGSRVYFFSLIGCSQPAVLCASVIMFTLNIMLPALAGIHSLQYFWKKEYENS